MFSRRMSMEPDAEPTQLTESGEHIVVAQGFVTISTCEATISAAEYPSPVIASLIRSIGKEDHAKYQIRFGKTVVPISSAIDLAPKKYSINGDQGIFSEGKNILLLSDASGSSKLYFRFPSMVLFEKWLQHLSIAVSESILYEVVDSIGNNDFRDEFCDRALIRASLLIPVTNVLYDRVKALKSCIFRMSQIVERIHDSDPNSISVSDLSEIVSYAQRENTVKSLPMYMQIVEFYDAHSSGTDKKLGDSNLSIIEPDDDYSTPCTVLGGSAADGISDSGWEELAASTGKMRTSLSASQGCSYSASPNYTPSPTGQSPFRNSPERSPRHSPDPHSLGTGTGSMMDSWKDVTASQLASTLNFSPRTTSAPGGIAARKLEEDSAVSSVVAVPRPLIPIHLDSVLCDPALLDEFEATVESVPGSIASSMLVPSNEVTKPSATTASANPSGHRKSGAGGEKEKEKERKNSGASSKRSFSLLSSMLFVNHTDSTESSDGDDDAASGGNESEIESECVFNFNDALEKFSSMKEETPNLTGEDILSVSETDHDDDHNAEIVADGSKIEVEQNVGALLESCTLQDLDHLAFARTTSPGLSCSPPDIVKRYIGLPLGLSPSASRTDMDASPKNMRSYTLKSFLSIPEQPHPFAHCTDTEVAALGEGLDLQDSIIASYVKRVNDWRLRKDKAADIKRVCAETLSSWNAFLKDPKSIRRSRKEVIVITLLLAALVAYLPVHFGVFWKASVTITHPTSSSAVPGSNGTVRVCPKLGVDSSGGGCLKGRVPVSQPRHGRRNPRELFGNDGSAAYDVTAAFDASMKAYQNATNGQVVARMCPNKYPAIPVHKCAGMYTGAGRNTEFHLVKKIESMLGRTRRALYPSISECAASSGCLNTSAHATTAPADDTNTGTSAAVDVDDEDMEVSIDAAAAVPGARISRATLRKTHKLFGDSSKGFDANTLVKFGNSSAITNATLTYFDDLGGVELYTKLTVVVCKVLVKALASVVSTSSKVSKALQVSVNQFVGMNLIKLKDRVVQVSQAVSRFVYTRFMTLIKSAHTSKQISQAISLLDPARTVEELYLRWPQIKEVMLLSSADVMEKLGRFGEDVVEVTELSLAVLRAEARAVLKYYHNLDLDLNEHWHSQVERGVHKGDETNTLASSAAHQKCRERYDPSLLMYVSDSDVVDSDQYFCGLLYYDLERREFERHVRRSKAQSVKTAYERFYTHISPFAFFF